MKTISEHNMPLLSRKRIVLEVENHKTTTPSRVKIRSEIAKHLKAKEELVAIRHIYQKYGGEKTKIIAHIYDNEQVRNRLDPLKKKEKPKEEAKEA